METKHYTRLIAGAIALLSCAGCSTFQASGDALTENFGGNRPSQEAEVANVKYKTPPEFTHLEGYLQSWEGIALDVPAGTKAWHVCTSKFGLDPVFEDVALPPGAGSTGTFYGQPSASRVDEFGYKKPKGIHGPGPGFKLYQRKAGVSDAALEEAREKVGMGRNDGCLSQEKAKADAGASDGSFASREKQRAASRLAWQAMLEAVHTTENLASVEQATKRWQVCMNEAGFDVSSPQDQAYDVVKPSAQDNPDPQKLAEEKRTARADVQCRSTSGYSDAYIAGINEEHSKYLLERLDEVQDSAPEKRAARREHLKKYLAGKL